MKVKQISVFLENKAGRLYEVTKTLADAGINIRALSLADTSDFGILRLIVNDPDKAVSILKENDFTVSETDVVAVEVEDKPGGLFHILQILNENEINVEYSYAFLGRSSDKAILIFRFENPDEVIDILKKYGVSILKDEILYKL